jgi:hypothetical protein
VIHAPDQMLFARPIDPPGFVADWPMGSAGRCVHTPPWQIDEVREYMRNRNLPPQLRRRVRLYLEDVYRQGSFNEQDMLSKLPVSMKREVQERIYGQC